MGNRAVVCFDEYSDEAVGVYLHWNGGKDSILGLLQATKQIMGDRLGDSTYGKARFIEAVTVFIDGNLSVGLGQCKELDCDNYDNGVYVVDSQTMQIIGREFHSGDEQSDHDPQEIADIIIDRINKGLKDD